MKEKLTKNLGLKILSVLIAFFLWLLVVNVSNPEISRSQEVTIEFLNEDVLTNAGKSYEVNRHTVTVAYDVHTLDEGRIRASDFRATVDLSELYDVTGSVQITIEVLNNASLMRNVTPRPSVVHVTTEDMQSKEFSLVANITGRPMENYSVNTVYLDPQTITVTGPVSQIGLINSVGVEISVMRSGDDLSGTAGPIFYDANGNELPASSTNKVTTDVEEIAYYIGIDRDREIPVTFNVTGTPAPGYRYAGYQATANNVRLSGTDAVLSSLQEIVVSSTELNIEGATSDKTVQIDLSASLPSGVYLTDPDQSIVDVRLLIEELVNETVNLSQSEITITGMDESLNYRLPSPAVTLIVSGTESELATVRVEDYGVILDVTGLDEGSHSIQPQYSQDDPRFSVIQADPVMVDIMRRNQGPGMLPGDREPLESRETAADEAQTEAPAEEETTEEESETSYTETEEEESQEEMSEENEMITFIGQNEAYEGSVDGELP